MSIERDISGDAVAVGDVIEFLGRSHTLTEIKPHPERPECRIGYSGDRWGITLDPSNRYRVHTLLRELPR